MKEEKKKGSIQAELNFILFLALMKESRGRKHFILPGMSCWTLTETFHPGQQRRKLESLEEEAAAQGPFPPTWCGSWCPGGCLHCSLSDRGCCYLQLQHTALKHMGPLGGKHVHIFPLHNSLCKSLPAKTGYGSPRSPSLLLQVKDAWVNTFPLQ